MTIFPVPGEGVVAAAAQPRSARMKERAARGVLWVGIDVFGGQALSFAAFLLLARLLSPGDYGLVTLAWAVLALPNVVLQDGLAEALVQRETLRAAHVGTAFWANVGLALLFIAAIELGAGWFGAWTGAPEVAPVLRATAPTLLFAAIGSIGGSMFRRDFDYAAFARRTFIGISLGAAVGIGLAVLGFGVWSLVGMQASGAAVAAAVLSRGLDGRPRTGVSLEALREIQAIASRLMLSYAIRFAAEKVDAIVIAIYLGTTALGYYYLATRLVATVTTMILPVDTVMMPVLARMQGDAQRLGRTYLDMVWTGNALWVPAMAGCGMISPIAIPLFFGAHWAPAVPLMLVVSCAALTHGLMRPTQHLLLSRGRPEMMARLNLLQLVVAVLAFLVGVRFGTIGAAAAFAMVGLAMVPFHLRAVHVIGGIAPGVVLRRYAPIVAAAAVMVAALLGIAAIGWGRVPTLAAELVAGPCVYAAALALVARAELGNLLGVVQSLRAGRG